MEEETGITNVHCGKLRHVSFHTYRRREKDYLKETVWYDMHIEGTQELTPQAEEDISQAIWMDEADVPSIYSNTYGSIYDVLVNPNKA